MAAYSIHLGLNLVNSDSYDGWNGTAAACVNAAKKMHEIAEKNGYKPKSFLNEEAKSENLIGFLSEISEVLKEGDELLVTFSGHGGRVVDASGDECNGFDETLCLYDRMFVDDEFNTLWAKFSPGVKVLGIIESCYSGTIFEKIGSGFYVLSMPQSVLDQYTLSHEESLKAGQFLTEPSEVIEASIIVISACQDEEPTFDGPSDGYGSFTRKLLEVYADGAFKGTIREFYDEVYRAVYRSFPQRPNFERLGKENPKFEAQSPFRP